MGTTPPHVAASPPPKGGNGGIRDPTRRRHADSQLLMLQTPTATGVESAGGPGRGTGEIGRLGCGLRAAVRVGGRAWPSSKVACNSIG